MINSYFFIYISENVNYCIQKKTDKCVKKKECNKCIGDTAGNGQWCSLYTHFVICTAVKGFRILAELLGICGRLLFRDLGG